LMWRFSTGCCFTVLIQRSKLKRLRCKEYKLRWIVLMNWVESVTVLIKQHMRVKDSSLQSDSPSKRRVVSNLKSGFHLLERSIVVKASLVGRKESMWEINSSGKLLILSMSAEFSITGDVKFVMRLGRWGGLPRKGDFRSKSSY
jgi:hypothetical protein